MIIVYGTHRFGLRKAGVRKDYCNSCKGECISEMYRSFDCGHIFYIPLLPLGTKKRWLCTHCGQDPRARYETSKAMRFLALLLFPIPILVFLLNAIEDWNKPANDAWVGLAIAGGFGVLWSGLLYQALKPKTEPTEEELRKEIVPLGLDSCVYCYGPLCPEPGAHAYCTTCKVVTYAD